MLRKALVLFLAIGLTSSLCEARSYSSGGKSYSSRSSSSSSSGSRSRSSSSSGGSSSSSRSYSSGKSYSSGSSRTYSPPPSTPSAPSSSRSSPSDSGRTYSSGSGGKTFSSASSDSRAKSDGKPNSVSPKSAPDSSSSGRSYSSGSSSGAKTFVSPNPSARPGSPPDKPNSDGSKSSALSFDTAAAEAQKQAASKRDFSAWKRNQASDIPTTTPRRSYSDSTRPPILNPDRQTYATRTVRIEHYYSPYYSRPVVLYRDPYSSFFWWWLLDRSLDERAMWAYHHRSSMDEARYQALLASDAALQARVNQLEAERVQANPNYVPSGLDRDLMYTDREFNRAYATRPTRSGKVFFWLIMVPTVAGVGCFFVWFLFFKRWRTA